MTVPVLEARGVSLGYDGRTVLDGLDLSIGAGTVTTLVGANGCGKSTLLKAFGRLLTPSSGSVLLEGRPVGQLRSRAVARRLAILPQNPVAPAGTSVRDLVMRGRNPHQSWARPWTPGDDAVVERVLADTGLAEVADRAVTELSGGQRQRAWIALVLAQEAPTLLLDEPTTFLDLAHQLDVLRLVRRVNRTSGTTVVMVLHDLGLAARYSDRLVVIGEGGVLADGDPADVLEPTMLERAFGLRARVIPDPVTGTPLVLPEADEEPAPPAETGHHPLDQAG
ncbi:ABC transporter ATP-binding protein [Streptomyces mangrovisoli]|uniref:ABC transporter ATP-binding protein n=1 Tax=Streptomyces mangrovisoli TaxID=1428628 RepID=UPI000A44BBF8|nr:ABC transporter ATP-binding protein [Streptomyces mangrovisoli]